MNVTLCGFRARSEQAPSSHLAPSLSLSLLWTELCPLQIQMLKPRPPV